MKKLGLTVLAAALLAGCGNAAGQSAAATTDASAKSEGTMTYQEYVDAKMNSEVTVETFVQAKQGWWEDNGVGKASLYTQDADGAYFVYNLPISEEDYNKLVEGQKVKLTGYKTEWSGEVELTDAAYEILDGNYVAAPVDVTDKLADDALIDYQNQKVTFTGLEVVEANDNGDAFMYNWDGSGTQGDDLYFNVTDGTNTYQFTVESYLCGKDTDVYKAVEALNVGDKIDAEGFLYWYNGANPHITTVTVK